MKALRVLLLLLLIFLVAGYGYWKRTEPEIPMQRTFVNDEGKSLEATVVGRTGQILHVQRNDDGARFELEFGKLGWKDRLFAERLPEQAPPPIVEKDGKETADPYVTSRRTRIEELKRKEAEFTAEIESGALNNLLARKRREDLLSVEKEIIELQGAIDAHLARGKSK